jgi:uncharacterized protein (DUF1800 family)
VSERSIALNRFGLGARPDEEAPADPRIWLASQMTRYDPRPAPLQSLSPTATIVGDVADYQARARAVRRAGRADQVVAPGAPLPDQGKTTMSADEPVDAAMVLRRDARRELRFHYTDAVDARIAVALTTPTPFAERLVHFWANHFAVSADNATIASLTGAFEFEAIRPHIMGRFADLLMAAERHPAMLLYLNQAVSIGPGSSFGQRPRVAARKAGLNENLAREILELHTLGVRTGYAQEDVTELARALTGWTVPGIGRRTGMRDVTGDYGFVSELHEPGPRTILGKSYEQAGEGQAQAVLNDLARHPATAVHIATKLARHFAGDTPPPAMVARLEQAFVSSGGDLPTVYRAIIASPEAWAVQPVKFRSPWEWSIAAMRATGARAPAQGAGVGLQTQLGQEVWKPGQPNGFDDTASTWAGSDALMRRVEAAERLAQRSPETDSRALATALFPDALTPATAEALRRAESPGQALALLLVAPEMMRR